MLITKNLVLTNEVNEKVREAPAFRAFINSCIKRHFNLDFGNIDDHDKEINLKAVKFGGRVMSIYEYSPITKIYIITEADRSVTTILFPEEY